MTDNTDYGVVSRFASWPRNIGHLTDEQSQEVNELLFGAQSPFRKKYNLYNLEFLINVDMPLYPADNYDSERISVVSYMTNQLNQMSDIDLMEVLCFYKQHGTKSYPVKTSILKVLLTSSLNNVQWFFVENRGVLWSICHDKTKCLESFEDPMLIAKKYCNDLKQLLMGERNVPDTGADALETSYYAFSDDDIYT